MSYLLDKGMVLLGKIYKQIKQSQVYNKGNSASATLQKKYKMSSSNVCLDTDIAPLRDLQVPPMCCTSTSPQARKAKSEIATAKLQLPESTFKTKCSS